jgi:hypothetical protein
MPKHIARIALFVGLLLGFDRLIYTTAMYMRDHGRQPQGIDLIYQDKSWSPEIVFVGDSRIKRNFDMQTVESLTGLSAYDFGYDNASAEEALFILEQFLSHKSSPRVVVFEADPPMLDKAYGLFHREHFRTYLAVVPDPEDLLRPQALTSTIQQRATTFAVTWLMKSAALPNRIPDLMEYWYQRNDAQLAEKVRVDPCGPKNSMRCRSYNNAVNFMHGSNGDMTPRTLPFSATAERKALYEYVVELSKKNNFSLILLQSPRLSGDDAYSAELKGDADSFFCGLAQSQRNVLYASMIHTDGMDRDASLYWDWEHFNDLGATKISQLIAPLIVAMANGSRPEPCLLR